LHGNEEDKKKIKELQNEVMHLKIETKAREQVINYMTDDRKEFWNQLEKSVDEVRRLSVTVGKLETQLQLTAPSNPETEQTAPLEISVNSEDFFPMETSQEETEHDHSQPVDQPHSFEVK
jgi:K+/H+ antiporter YhaU regulatory subunit KhtT